MDSYWAQYVKEREDLETFSDENGFFTYRVDYDCLFISDLFVVPEKRRNGIGTVLGYKIEEIALENGRDVICCSVDKSTNNWKQSLLAIQSAKYIIEKEDKDFIYLIKYL